MRQEKALVRERNRKIKVLLNKNVTRKSPLDSATQFRLARKEKDKMDVCGLYKEIIGKDEILRRASLFVPASSILVIKQQAKASATKNLFRVSQRKL